MKKPSSFEIVKEALEVGGTKYQALGDKTITTYISGAALLDGEPSPTLQLWVKQLQEKLNIKPDVYLKITVTKIPAREVGA